MIVYLHYDKIKGMRLLVMLFCLLCTTAHAAEPLHGMARVYDGDTIRIGDTSIRIWGIDAVELKQRCALDGKDIACGQMARDALAGIINGRTVTCTPRGRSYKRVVATCMAGGMDVAAEMARLGMAQDYAQYSHGFYAGDEQAARTRRAGIWAMTFDAPSFWRACNLPQRKNRRPADCMS